MRAFIVCLALTLSLAVGSSASAEKAKPRPAADAEVQKEDDQGLGALFQAAPATVRARLGDPDVARAEGRGAFWTYRLPHCALFIFFREGPKGLRVSGGAVGPRKRGEPVMTVSACLATAVVVGE